MIQAHLLNSAIQQTRALLVALEALSMVLQETAPECPHPQDKIVTLGTMGHSTQICSLCQKEVPIHNQEAAP